MNIEIAHLQLALQAVSSLSIGAGFLFAAYQFANARHAQKVANFTRLVELQMQLRRMRVEDPALASVYQDDVADLRTPDSIRRYFFNLLQLSVFEIAWYARQQNQLSPEYFASWERRMRIICAEKSFQEMMNNPAMKLLHDQFERYIQELMREVTLEQSRRSPAPQTAASQTARS